MQGNSDWQGTTLEMLGTFPMFLVQKESIQRASGLSGPQQMPKQACFGGISVKGIPSWVQPA